MHAPFLPEPPCQPANLQAGYAGVKEVPCNLCDLSDYSVLFDKTPDGLTAHRIVRCNRCGLMYANPQELVDCEKMLQEQELPALDLQAVNAQYFRKQHVQLPDNLRALKVLDELLPQRGRLLEIGSYLGILLDRIRADGWNTTGLEPERSAATYSRKTYQLNIVEGVLPQPELAPDSFDAVMMLHVIEHMPNPAADLREIRRLLHSGGILVVETPRFDSLMFKLLGRRERSMNNCAGHIYFFSVPTLRKLVEKCGFEVVRTELVGRTLTADRFVYNLGLMTRSRDIQRGLARLSNSLKLDRLQFHANARDMQRIYCRAK
ncbi:MAG TPA: class I SAM-dependent methyltransferase [Verrucomicrobiae bacterium]|nr:class I SAM-dependent methyltransferase [Verrucomicrobiae bacterium]